MADGPKDGQREIDFVRAEQLRLLRDCELPREARDRAGRRVSATVLKAMLSAMDHYGRGRAGGAFASVATLAKAANVGLRTATRAIEVLVMLGLVCVTRDGPTYGVRGSTTNRYTIVWSELAILADRGLFARRSERPGSAPEERDHSATRTDHSATRTDHSATRTDHSATGGAQSAFKRFEAPSKRPDVRRDEDGAKSFNEDELAAVRFKANTIDKWIAATEPADRELVLKVAVLWQRRGLPEDAVEQVLESFQRKREAGESIDRPCGWLWATLRDQAAKHGLRLERLLARTPFPAELLVRPAGRQVPT